MSSSGNANSEAETDRTEATRGQTVGLAVTTICHPGFVGFLPGHLRALANAMREAGVLVPVHVLFSDASRPDHGEQAASVAAGFNEIDVRLEVVKQRLTCAEARNRVRRAVDGEAWVVFLDVDVDVEPDYFICLRAMIDAIGGDKRVVALAGGIRAKAASRIGYLEYLMDIQSYYGKVGDGQLGVAGADLDALGDPADAEGAEALRSYEFLESRYLQGFNHVVHTKVFDAIPYDDRFFGAEDRDYAALLITAGFRVLFAPSCAVRHSYNFTTWDICRRKYGHGYYSSMFRHKHHALGTYRSGLSVWREYTWQQVVPPRSFRSPLRRLYWTWAFSAFSAGTLVAVYHRLRERPFLFSFDYSKYSFRQR